MMLLRDAGMEELFDEVVEQFRLSEHGSHGPAHWERVGQFGEEIGERTPGADLKVIRLFALLHDSQRRDEWVDPGHGPRAAEYARTLVAEGWFDLTLTQKRLLFKAIREHSDGKTTTDPTIGSCWDADRLDLDRIGVTPLPELMSTAHGKLLCKSMFAGDLSRDIVYRPELTS